MRRMLGRGVDKRILMIYNEGREGSPRGRILALTWVTKQTEHAKVGFLVKPFQKL